MGYCLITGGRGFIATAAASHLRAQGRDVLVVSRSPGVGEILYAPDALQVAFEQNDITDVVHLAARKDRSDTTVDLTGTLVQVNVSETLHLASLCARKPGFQRFVFVGTCDEYGACPTPYVETCREHPISAYGASKLAATHSLQMLARSCNFPVVIARPSLVYGPGQTGDMFIPSLLAALTGRRKFQMSHGQQMRDFLYIDDLLKGLDCLLDTPGVEGQVFNLAVGKSQSLNEVVEVALTVFGDSDMVKNIHRDTRFGHRNDTAEYSVAVDAAQMQLGWRARTPLHEGIAQTLKWIQSS